MNETQTSTSTESRDYRRRPLCLEATGALIIAGFALGSAILGIYNPWAPLRFVSEPSTANKVPTGIALLFITPIVLGIVAGLLGGYASRVIERSRTPMRGDGFAFFSIMIGLFAAIIGACTTFAVIIWPSL